MLALLAAAALAALPVQQTPPPHAMPSEDAVDPYTASDANVGARAFTGDGMARAFHGKDGIGRIVDRFVALNFTDAKIGEIFQGHDRVRITRTLKEHFCHILNAGCTYPGRDMKSSHKNLGIQHADMNRIVEILQIAMREEGVAFAAQNRFLSKLAPMRGDIVGR